jgi:hypothetical protein
MDKCIEYPSYENDYLRRLYPYDAMTRKGT